MRLGVNSVNVGVFNSVEVDLYIYIGDLLIWEVERFLFGNCFCKVFEMLVDIFFGVW